MTIYRRRNLVIGVVLVIIVAGNIFTIANLTNTNVSLSREAGISGMNAYDVPGSDPWDIAFDGGGRVWVTMPGCDLGTSCSSSTPPGKLALFDPNTESWPIVVSLPAGYGQPTFVAVDPHGKVWFTMPITNAIGMYDPGSGTVSQWIVPTSHAGPWGIAVDQQGQIWFTEHYASQVGSFNPISQTFQEITTSTPKSEPYGITIDSAGNKWFTENLDAVASIGEYTNQGVLEEYKIRNTPTAGTGLTPHLITTDYDGHVWWSEGWASAIGMLNVASAQPGTNQGVTEYHYTPACRNCGSHTSGISVDRRGLVWFDDSLQDDIGSLAIGRGKFAFYPSEAHPDDGFDVDKQDRIWFAQESGNHLVVVVQPPAPVALAQDFFQ